MNASVGQIVHLRPQHEQGQVEEDVLPLYITHVHGNNRVSGVVLTAFPVVGHLPFFVAKYVSQGVWKGQWSWPPRG